MNSDFIYFILLHFIPFLVHLFHFYFILFRLFHFYFIFISFISFLFHFYFIFISFISFISFSGDPEKWNLPDRPPRRARCVVFGSCVTVWAAGVEVAGSSPTCGILSQMCECVISFYTFTHSRNCAKMPDVGIEPATLGPTPQTATQLTNWEDGHSQISREILRNPCVS